jgi:LysR family glycine cleavage system transcriptional activator
MAHIPSLATLRAFEAAARHRSFSRAGDELGLTHGAISHRIRELEEQVGERLFTRRGNTMEPTQAAGRYLASVRKALDLLTATFGTGAGDTVRTLRIAVLPSFASHWLVPRLHRFQTEHPDIAVSLDARLDVMPLGRGHADAAIRQGDGSWPGVHAERLIGETAFPVCAPAYRERMKIKVPHDLSRCHLLRHSWLPWTTWFTAARVDLPEPNDSAAFTDAGLLIDMAIAGHGVMLGRDVLAADALATGRLVRLFDTNIPVAGAYWFVRPHAGGKLAKEITAFGEWLAATLAREFPTGQSAGADSLSK